MNIERSYIKQFINEGFLLDEPVTLQEIEKGFQDMGFNAELKGDIIYVEDQGLKYHIFTDKEHPFIIYLMDVDDNGERKCAYDEIVDVFGKSRDAIKLLAQVVEVNREFDDLAKALDKAQGLPLK